VENYPPRIEAASANFKRSPYRDRITLVAEDAGKVIERLTEENRSFSFIFMDAAKAQYPVWLPGILRLMRPGSVLVSDNILQDGSIVESRYQVNRRDRTIHTRMREYLYTLKHHPELETSIIPIGDGVSMSVKRPL
jgi:predicted O-methyltransferase YrrM